MKQNKIFSFIIVAVFSVLMFTGCNSISQTNKASDDPSLSGTYVFVAKDMQNPYMQKVYEGFNRACNEFKAKSLYLGPEAPTSQKQIEIIERLIELNVSGIAIAANDENELQPALSAAMDAGIKVISLDSAVNKDSRQVHIQQADPERIGRELIRSAHEIAEGSGGIAILSSTKQAPNQNLWISWMKKEINENPQKYADTPIVKIVYGDDDPTKSASEAQALAVDPSIKVIIAPTIIGMKATADVLKDMDSSIKLTGLGLPSKMAPFIENGICPRMYLWNPVDIGYLAGYTLNALIDNKITGDIGNTFSAGSLGEKTITADATGGTEVILGDPYKFDLFNIAEWKSIY